MQTRKPGIDSQCPICSNDFNVDNERKLPCQHALCLNCIQVMIRKNETKTSHLICPLCRCLFTIPIGLLKLPISEQILVPYVKEKYRAKIERSTEQSSLQCAGKITGMAILDNALFVCCRNKPKVIYKYDIDSELGFIANPSEIEVPDVVWSRGMAANEDLCCLYITDWNTFFGGRLWRFSLRDNSNAEPPGAVSVVFFNQQPFGVSYSTLTNQVLVTCATPVNIFKNGGSVHIFQDLGESFDELRVVGMPHVEIPRHTLFTHGYKYVTCHGWTIQKHGVTCFKQNESEDIFMEKFYCGGVGEQGMNQPLSMYLDADGLILVVDYGNNRIQLLTENLIFVRHLITAEEHHVSDPRHVCLHPNSGRMFVGQEDGHIHIFDALIE